MVLPLNMNKSSSLDAAAHLPSEGIGNTRAPAFSSLSQLPKVKSPFNRMRPRLAKTCRTIRC